MGHRITSHRTFVICAGIRIYALGWRGCSPPGPSIHRGLPSIGSCDESLFLPFCLRCVLRLGCKFCGRTTLSAGATLWESWCLPGERCVWWGGVAHALVPWLFLMCAPMGKILWLFRKKFQTPPPCPATENNPSEPDRKTNEFAWVPVSKIRTATVWVAVSLVCHLLHVHMYEKI